ncbi:class I SAM-dependent methyltransferase [Microbulbifer sp. OS29]|uniref:Ribosomal RNA small subunit methyltransferase J n=1 Tax=Microbulbifer okhotskensis TaxID=2926617 RepID=A0A9X2EM83_9GAMM|nr:class I SAM-dependent methyltransferase [Microbulbifer okhotskensis]MCO1334239.1 class I SAM-dependent methyltransferase [Microbulbifer okhotskensis]
MSHPMAIVAAALEYISAAEELSAQLGYPFLGVVPPSEVIDVPQVLSRGDQLRLCATGRKAAGPVLVDFVGGALAHRRRYGGGKAQPVAKAVGLRSGFYPKILDATAGLGRDAFVLAALGCEIHMLERNPVVFELLRDGLHRLRLAAMEDRELAVIAERMSLLGHCSSAADWLGQQPEESLPVVYLDPMFPPRGKVTKVKKEMVAFHHLVGADEDAAALLAPALTACYYRTVVKRPKLAPYLTEKKPSLSLEGKSGRFDIYTKHGVPG